MRVATVLLLLLINASPLLAQTQLELQHYLLRANQKVPLDDRPYAPFRVCADGAAASVFRLAGGGLNYSRIGIRVRNDLAFNTEPGEIIEQNRYLGSIEVVYRHPNWVKNRSGVVSLEWYVSSPSSTTTLGSFSVLVGAAPVLMVHGLNSDKSIYEAMEAQLLTANPPYGPAPYIPAQLLRVDYSATSRAAFATNDQVIKSAIDNVINKLKIEGIAAGKVDIVGHSMGGILARLYLQSADYLPRNDIHKLITLNTPHFGSHMANWLTDNEPDAVAIGRFLVHLDIWYVCRKDKDCDAFLDLRVNSEGIRTGVNGDYINRSTVPSHAIVTTSTLGEVTYLPEFILRPVEYLVLSTSLSTIYCGQDNDFLVSTESQQGGLPSSAYSLIPYQQQHSNSTKNNSVILKVEALLEASATSSVFHSGGFGKKILTYKECPAPSATVDTKNMQLVQATLAITSPQRGAHLRGGSQLTVAASGTNLTEIKTVVSFSSDSVYIAQEKGNSTMLPFHVDRRAGMRHVVVLGKTTDGTVVSDSTFFYISNSYCESLSSGNWSSGTTWSCGHEPTISDAVVINANHVVIVTTSTAQAQQLIYSGGKLRFTSPGTKVFIKNTE